MTFIAQYNYWDGRSMRYEFACPLERRKFVDKNPAKADIRMYTEIDFTEEDVPLPEGWFYANRPPA